MKYQKIGVLLLSVFFFSFAGVVFAYQTNLVYLSKNTTIQINNPETAQYFYDELAGTPKDYTIDAKNNFSLDISLLVPLNSNPMGKYSAKVFSMNGAVETQLYSLDGSSMTWATWYDPFLRDYYAKGPGLSQTLPAGTYKIEIFSDDNQGKYVLAVGNNTTYTISSALSLLWQIPLLKLSFFKTSALQFFLTIVGLVFVAALGGLVILIFLIIYLASIIKAYLTHKMAKTILLTSGGMDMRDEIIRLLQKPSYDVNVAFITTASKPEGDMAYVERELAIMKDMGFNVDLYDLDGKNENQVMEALRLKDIIFVEGGNTFYLLNSMRKCNFEKVIRKLLKRGIVYIGVSAGSIVAGKSIQVAEWLGNENIVGLKNLKGMNLVPFNIFVHYHPEDAAVIQQKIKNPKQRKKQLKILTDGQAILVQGKEIFYIGKGEQINI